MAVHSPTIVASLVLSLFPADEPVETDEPAAPQPAEIEADSAKEESGGWHHAGPFAYTDGLLGPLWGKRAELADHGLDVHLSLLVIGQSIVEGGLEEKAVLSASYDLQLYLDSAKLGLWDDGYALIRAEGKTNDNGVNPYTGAVVPVNFDAFVPEPSGNAFVPTEWWYAHELAGGTVEVVVGMWSIAKFFDREPFSGPYHYRFLNGHMFFNSVLLPYAPYNCLGGVLVVKPAGWLTITTGIYDPDSSAVDVNWFGDGHVNVLHEWHFTGRPFGNKAILSAGLAYTSAEQVTNAQDPAVPGTETQNGDWALYTNFTQWLYEDPADPRRAIGLFGRLSFSDGKVNLIGQHVSGGVSFDGMIPTRPDDAIGVAGWYNSLSDDLPATLDSKSWGFEAYYRFQVMPGMQLSADVQYLIEPGLQIGIDNALILGFRALIEF